MTSSSTEPAADPGGAPPPDVSFAAWEPMAPAAVRRHVGWALVTLTLAVAAAGFALWMFSEKPRALRAALAVVPAFAVLHLVRTVVWTRTFRFRITASTVETRARFLVTRTRYVPLGRIQHVDVSSGPIEQSLDVASVVGHTAAGDATIVVSGIATARAGALRDRLLTERRREAT